MGEEYKKLIKDLLKITENIFGDPELASDEVLLDSLLLENGMGDKFVESERKVLSKKIRYLFLKN